MIKLTARQQQVLDVIRHHIEETGYPPTRAEIADQLGFRSPNAAEEHLKALQRKGAIEMVPGASRGIRLPEGNSARRREPTVVAGRFPGLERNENGHADGLPVIGQVAAGSPLLATENIQSWSHLPGNFFDPPADYFLQVKGLSMRDAGILEGDLLAVHRTREARNGEIVVARLGEEVTVKRFEKRGNRVILHAENPDFSPIVVDESMGEFVIEGRYVGILRRH